METLIRKPLNSGLKDNVNLKLANIITNPDYELSKTGKLYNKLVLCWDRFSNKRINACDVDKSCVTEEQRNSCEALDLRLKKQGYDYEAKTFIDNYISLKTEQDNQKSNQIQIMENESHNKLIESMSEGYGV